MRDSGITDIAILAQKRQLRQQCRQNRRMLANKQALSRRICDQVTELHEYCNARTISTYVALPQEVQTQELIFRAWNDGKEVVVPCCLENELRLFHLKSMEDLAPRTLGILEPRVDLQQHEERWCDIAHIDLFVVPGVAFDRLGGRLGHGKGYYDRLLAKAHHAAAKIALAFECQISDSVPMTQNDRHMDCVITERGARRRVEL